MTETLPELKIWPGPMRAIRQGEKRYEVREEPNRWSPEEGDHVVLRKWLPEREEYAGPFLIVRVTRVTRSDPPSPLPEGIVVFGIEVEEFGFSRPETWEPIEKEPEDAPHPWSQEAAEAMESGEGG